MEPQPSTSSAGASTADGGPIDGIEEAVSSTSGSVPLQQQKHEEEFVFHSRVSRRQIQQLFVATCRVKVQRCQLPSSISPAGNHASVVTPSPSAEERPAVSKIVTVGKVEDDSSSCSEDDEDVKVLPPPPAVPPSKNKRPVTKKKGRNKVSQRKSPVHCAVCKKKISSKITLKIHMRKHTGEERYKCEKCKRSFWSSSSFSSHKKKRYQQNGVCPPARKRIVGWMPKGSWKCKICGKRMECGSHYLPHMRSHPRSKPFKCEECGKGFRRGIDLSDHRRIHTGVWQFSCVFCDKGFHQQSNMFSHLRRHTDEKPFFCVVDGCGESFRHSGSLRNHRRLVHLKKY